MDDPEYPLAHCSETELVEMLHKIQSRLGKSQEEKTDFQKAILIMHQLNNIRTERMFQHQFERS
jgi:hypothetical protein